MDLQSDDLREELLRRTRQRSDQKKRRKELVDRTLTQAVDYTKRLAKKPYVVVGLVAGLFVCWIGYQIANSYIRYKEYLEVALATPDEQLNSPDLQPELSDSTSFGPEHDEWNKAYDKLKSVWEAEKKGVNWRLIPDDEKNVRLTTGHVVFEGADSRLIVGNFSDGSPRFIIQQATPHSVGANSRKLWITKGVQDGWMPDGKTVKFFADDTILYGSWGVRDKNGELYAEIRFENFKHTGELEGIDFFDDNGNRKGGVFWLDGKWAGSATDSQIREAEDVVKTIRGYVSQIPEF